LTEQGNRLDDLIPSLAKDIVSMRERIEKLKKDLLEYKTRYRGNPWHSPYQKF